MRSPYKLNNTQQTDVHKTPYNPQGVCVPLARALPAPQHGCVALRSRRRLSINRSTKPLPSEMANMERERLEFTSSLA